MNDQQRLGHPVEHALEVQGVGLLLRLRLIRGLRIKDVAAFRQRIEGIPAFAQVVGAGPAHDGAKATLVGRGSQSVDGGTPGRQWQTDGSRRPAGGVRSWTNGIFPGWYTQAAGWYAGVPDTVQSRRSAS